MAATDFGTLFLDTSLRIKRFTPRLTDLFNVTPNDEGRPITDFTHALEYDDMADRAAGVERPRADRAGDSRPQRQLVSRAHAALPDDRGQDRRRCRDLRRHHRTLPGRGGAAKERGKPAPADAPRRTLSLSHLRLGFRGRHPRMEPGKRAALRLHAQGGARPEEGRLSEAPRPRIIV